MASFDRRTFVAGVLGASGVLALQPPGAALAATDPTKCTTRPKVFKPGQDTRPVAPRRNVGVLLTDHAWMTKFQKGYAHIRAMNQNDPRSWTQQGRIHAIMCSGQPFEVHESTRFLAWHRCYLYFHERIIAWASTGGQSLDPTFRLALWNWEGNDLGVNSTPSFPAAFTQGSLKDQYRQPTYSPGDGNIKAALATPLITGTQGIYGQPYSPSSSGSALLENASHGQIHVDTGYQNNNPPPNPPGRDMGVLATAGYDPVFFAHHGNIDKVWAWWQSYNPGKTPASIDPNTHQPYDPAWAATTWQFYDYDGSCWSITAADTPNYTRNLRYTVPAPPPKPTTRRVALGVAGPTLTAQSVSVPSTGASVLLEDLTIPPPGRGSFGLVATVDGKPHVVGHFAVFGMEMNEPRTLSVQAQLDPQGVQLLSKGVKLQVVPETKKALSPFAVTGANPKAAELHASSAALLL